MNLVVRPVDRRRNPKARWCDHPDDDPIIQICRMGSTWFKNKIYELDDEENRVEFIRSNALMNFISYRAVYVYLEFIHICIKVKISVLSTRHRSKFWRVLSTWKWREYLAINCGEFWRVLSTIPWQNWRTWRDLENMEKFGEHGECLALYRGEIGDHGKNWRPMAKIGHHGEC